MNENKKLSERERNNLMKRLHSHLFWVGEQIPCVIELKGNDVHLHEVVWEIVNKSEHDEYDLKSIDMFISLLYEKEKECEKCLGEKNLTCEEAKKIFNETAGLMRAIMNLKEITQVTGKKSSEKHICKNVTSQEWDKLKLKICPK
ncbi:DUF5788 family protein [Methanolobus sp. ZRKC3]|uniref:DUF5788 family protein n=1 Tax=Methanolobus sp. ZRKC3 TaxID=3125786 RepID=UPI0032475095